MTTEDCIRDNSSICIELIEVSESKIEFNTISAAERFLGVGNSILSGYIKHKVKIIKSKVNGKTYLIKKKAKNG